MQVIISMTSTIVIALYIVRLNEINKNDDVIVGIQWNKMAQKNSMMLGITLLN